MPLPFESVNLPTLHVKLTPRQMLLVTDRALHMRIVLRLLPLLPLNPLVVIIEDEIEEGESRETNNKILPLENIHQKLPRQNLMTPLCKRKIYILPWIVKW